MLAEGPEQGHTARRRGPGSVPLRTTVLHVPGPVVNGKPATPAVNTDPYLNLTS